MLEISTGHHTLNLLPQEIGRKTPDKRNRPPSAMARPASRKAVSSLPAIANIDEQLDEVVMKPIEYLEQLALEESRPSADGSAKLLDGSARRAFDAFKFGYISEDDAVIMFMKSQKEKAEFYLNESINLRMNSTSTPIFIGG